MTGRAAPAPHDGAARPQPCDVPTLPHALTRARLYPCGWRCALHSPAALAGRSEPPPGPGWPAGAWSTPIGQGVAALIDERAIASGKRRSNHHDFRAAQAAVRREREDQP